MGCVATKFEEDEEIVSICRERKHFLKLGVEKRYALAEAHFRYCESVRGVSAALKLFVARHSSSSFLITFPPPSSPKPQEKTKIHVSNPLFIQQNHPPIDKDSAESSCSGSDERKEEEKQSDGCFYIATSPEREFGWDFFDPFGVTMMTSEVMNVYNRDSDDGFKLVREEEGIPDLELEDEQEQQQEIERKVEFEAPKQQQQQEEEEEEEEEEEQGRDLLEALKEIEGYFNRVYKSGSGVSKMLESNRIHLQSGLQEIKENSTKLIQAITVRSTSYRSTTCKSLVASNSKTASKWTEFNNDLFDDGGGMNSGSHSLTLGRLYAWEKKLYEEVKAGDNTRKLYERKCSQLRNQDVKGDEGVMIDKTRAAVKDLYSQILVAIRRVEVISERIEKLRDEELQPQIIELLHGMMNMWKAMLESHEIQTKIMFEVKLFTGPTYGTFSNNTHRLATLQLEAELQNWRACFREYLNAQKQYVGALYSWLSKLIVPEVQVFSKSRNFSKPFQTTNGPPLLMIFQEWFNLMDKLPEQSLFFAMKSFSKDLHALWIQQRKEQEQKRKVDSLAKEFDRKILAFQKTENRVFESKSPNLELCELDNVHREDYLKERKDYIDEFRAKVELERRKHQNCMQETQKITLNGIQTGFCSVFEALVEYSKGSLQMYSDLVEKTGNADNSSYIKEDESSR